MIKAALIGFGGIAQIHRYSYWYLAEKMGKPVELVAAFDLDPAKFTAKTKINIPLGEMTEHKPIHFYTDLEEMLSKEEIDFLDICLPPKLHASMTAQMMARGYSVLCEKPMAHTDEECESMLKAAKESGKTLMIGHSVRFSPYYECLHDMIESGKYGKPVSAVFERYSPPPAWSANAWQMDIKQSGGCLFELNIHDVDVVRWLFGEPKEISCKLESRNYERDTFECGLGYDGHTVTVRGGWLTPEDAFRCGYEVTFENAVVCFDGTEITVKENGKAPEKIEIEDREPIIDELDYFTDVLEGKIKNTKNSPEGSAKTIALLHKFLDCAFENKTMKWED